MKVGDPMYRYMDHLVAPLAYDDVPDRFSRAEVRVSCYEYVVVRKTPKGAWIAFSKNSHRDSWKFVLDNATKRFAHETREKALESFRYRKQRQAEIYRKRLKQVEQALFKAQNANAFAIV